MYLLENEISIPLVMVSNKDLDFQSLSNRCIPKYLCKINIANIVSSKLSTFCNIIKKQTHLKGNKKNYQQEGETTFYIQTKEFEMGKITRKLVKN